MTEDYIKREVAEYEQDLMEASRKGALAGRTFLLTLQEFMWNVNVYDGKVPNAGQFCSYCYGPRSHKQTIIHALETMVRASKTFADYMGDSVNKDWISGTWCPYCFGNRIDFPLVDKIPEEVLLIYNNHRVRKETGFRALEVPSVAIGIVIGGFLFFAIQGWFRFLSCFIPIITGILGAALGGMITARIAVRAQDKEWLEFVARRGD